jgi:peptidoglycan/LPS O-acetylase OafA/YrhL
VTVAAETEPTTRIAELDGLRGLAILQVVLLHYFVTGIKTELGSLGAYTLACFRLMWTGVDLFFVLSGFLIGGILLNQKKSPNYYRAFYARRVCRIFPLYYLNIFIFFALLLIFGTSLSYWLFKNPAPLLSYLTFTQNFFFNRQAFWALWLAPTWSLAIEEQFYLFLPLLVRTLSERKLLWAVLASILAAPVFRFLFANWHAQGLLTGDGWVEMMMVTRANSLMLGVFVAWLFRHNSFHELVKTHRRWLYLIFFILLLGMAGLTLKYPQANTVANAAALTWIALFYAVLLTLAVSHRQSWLGTALRNPLLLGLGAISYCVYLIHMPILGLCHSYFRKDEPSISNFSELSVTLLALLLTIVIARVSWRWLESPMIRLGHRVSYSA